MGEELDIRDVDGNLVRISLYATLATIAKHLATRNTSAVSVPVSPELEATLRIERRGECEPP